MQKSKKKYFPNCAESIFLKRREGVWVQGVQVGFREEGSSSLPEPGDLISSGWLVVLDKDTAKKIIQNFLKPSLASSSLAGGYRWNPPLLWEESPLDKKRGCASVCGRKECAAEENTSIFVPKSSVFLWQTMHYIDVLRSKGSHSVGEKVLCSGTSIRTMVTSERSINKGRCMMDRGCGDWGELSLPPKAS